jgi:hypothetical protein
MFFFLNLLVNDLREEKENVWISLIEKKSLDFDHENKGFWFP